MSPDVTLATLPARNFLHIVVKRMMLEYKTRGENTLLYDGNITLLYRWGKNGIFNLS